jgi:hypothetical protein
MNKRSKLFWTALLLAVITLLYFASIGLGVSVSKWFKINVETGCTETTDFTNVTKCNTGLYKCVVSNPFKFYAVCPIYGTAMIMLAIVIGIIYCIKKRCGDPQPDYYSQVIEWRE